MKLTMKMDCAEIRSVLGDYLRSVLGDGWTVEGIELVRRKSGDFEAEVGVVKGPKQIILHPQADQTEVGQSRKHELEALIQQRDREKKG